MLQTAERCSAAGILCILFFLSNINKLLTEHLFFSLQVLYEHTFLGMNPAKRPQKKLSNWLRPMLKQEYKAKKRKKKS